MKITYMGLEIFYTDAVYYMQMSGKMPLAVCSDYIDEEGYRVPDKDKPLGYILTPKQFEKVKHLLEEK